MLNDNAIKLDNGSSDSDCARLIPVGGGKGGVGKSFIVANLAASLARAGKRVVAVDGDLEGANLHTCLGIPKPRISLADFVAQREEDLGKLTIETPIPMMACNNEFVSIWAGSNEILYSAIPSIGSAAMTPGSSYSGS